MILHTNSWCLISLLGPRQVWLERKPHVSNGDRGKVRTCDDLGYKTRIKLD